VDEDGHEEEEEEEGEEGDRETFAANKTYGGGG
jgi:hypothetical protein